MVSGAFDSFARLAALSMAYICISAQMARPALFLQGTDDAPLNEIFHQAVASLKVSQDGRLLLTAVPKTFWVNSVA